MALPTTTATPRGAIGAPRNGLDDPLATASLNIALFGLGYVGSVTAACLAARGHRVVGIDADPVKVTALAEGRPPVVEPDLDRLVADGIAAGTLRAAGSAREALAGADVSFVCVGTPSTTTGGTDLHQVRRVVTEIGTALAGSTRPHTVVIRSTVPPGTVDEVVVPLLEQASGRRTGSGLGVAMCPEFLREGSGVADFHTPPFLVVGGDAEATRQVREVFGFLDCPTHTTTARTAEGVKYACNAFHALKVAFANELARLYRTLEVDTREVMEVFVTDHVLNISPAYLRPGFAFGGSCLPKDLRSLLDLARLSCVDLPVLRGALASNEMLVREVADRVLHAVEESGGSRRVALLGLSFKSDTDDLRESPYVAVAEILLGKGLDVRIHDPVVNPARLRGANRQYVQTRLPHLEKLLWDSAASALDGAAVAVVATGDGGVVDAVVRANPRVAFDLHGRLGSRLEALAGYQGVGW